VGGRAARGKEGVLLQGDDILAAQPRQVVGDAAADDARRVLYWIVRMSSK
jgi:hypothetical protein